MDNNQSDGSGLIDLELMTGVSASAAPADPDNESTASDAAETAGNLIAAQVQSGSVEIEPGTGLVKAKGKGKAKSSVLPPDPVSKAIHQIENLSADDARKKADELMDGTEFSTFQLGGVFSQVNHKKYFAEYGFNGFKGWVETTYGIQYRKAMYLVQIYDAVRDHDINWDQIKHLGWTKLKTLLNPNSNLITAENLPEWVKKAENMTVLQLESAVKSSKGTSAGEQASEQDMNATTKITFAAHADQKETIRSALEKAKELSGTSSDTVALEMIATEFLGKPAQAVQSIAPGVVASSVTQIVNKVEPEAFKQVGYMAVLEAFEQAFPDIELSVTLPSS